MPDAPRLTRPAALPAPPPGLVHLGPGAFFRGFIVPFTQEAIAAKGSAWGIRGISLCRPDLRDRLAPQGGVYHSVELGPGAAPPRLITCLRDLLVAPEDPEAALAALADPAIRIVTLTLTEKGYGHRPGRAQLDRSRPEIAHDLAAPPAPQSALGYLCAALARRRAAGARPFTVLSCDNLAQNGALTRALLLEMAGAQDPDLAAWIAQEGRFPCAMVDRITPAATEADIARLAAQTGQRDLAPSLHEPFRQWVIEDRFVDGARPAWEVAGAEFVPDVAPYERIKLWCLNGTHSALAYLGALAGHDTIAAASADPPFAALCAQLWAEMGPALTLPPGFDLGRYCATLLARYRNPAIQHRTAQIAMDGSQKLPQRILPPLAAARADGRECPGLTLVLAGWMGFVSRGAPIADPLGPQIAAALAQPKTPAQIVPALLGLEQIFPPDLARDPGLRAALVTALEGLKAGGARALLEDLAP